MTKARSVYLRLLVWLRRLLRNDQMILAALALVAGCLTGIAVIGFRELIAFV